MFCFLRFGHLSTHKCSHTSFSHSCRVCKRVGVPPGAQFPDNGNFGCFQFFSINVYKIPVYMSMFICMSAYKG